MKNKTEKQTNILPATVHWLPRYSETMEDDDTGRWARVAYAGKLDNINLGFFRGKVCRWEIAWIKKLHFNNKLYFTISYKYPNNGKSMFDDLPKAKKEVEKTFRWFINMCTNKQSKL